MNVSTFNQNLKEKFKSETEINFTAAEGQVEHENYAIRKRRNSDQEKCPKNESVLNSEEAPENEIFRRLSHFVENPEKVVRQILDEAWRLTHFQALPDWLKDNDFILSWHRPPMPSFTACLKSIFSIHSETGNIWTHMLGCALFIALTVDFIFSAPSNITWQETLVINVFFFSAILALAFSFLFHTFSCHSQFVGNIFCKLDYCGISLLIAGSFVPWLYYAFFCRVVTKVIYLVVIGTLASMCIIASFWDKLATPSYRPLRTFMFMAFGVSGVIPVTHYLISHEYAEGYTQASVGWLILMALLYLVGAVFYVGRIPERFFPGKCDIWFQSHQIFHILVVSAALVHYHGISNIALRRLSFGNCIASTS